MSLIKNLRARIFAFQHALNADEKVALQVAVVQAQAAERIAKTHADTAVKVAEAQLDLLHAKVSAALTQGQKDLAASLVSAEPGVKVAVDAAVTALVKSVLDSLA